MILDRSLDEPHIKNLILYKDSFYKKFVYGKNIQNHLNQFIQKPKQNYLHKVAKKLSNPSASTKCYWSF